MMRASTRLALSTALVLLSAGCQSPGIAVGKPATPNSPQHVDAHLNEAWDIFGSAHINQFGILCAGRVELKQGVATVNDRCFSGDTNVVLCTEMTAANPVKCTPGKDVLSIAGTGSDLISYARVK